MLGRVIGDSKETQTFVSTWDAWLPWSLAWHLALPSACQPDADDMAARTALRAEQWESDDAFLPSAHSRQSEANRNHSRAVGLYFKELSTAFLDTFCERTEQSLYLAQWLLKTATHLLLRLPLTCFLHLLGTAQALGPLGSHKAKPGRGCQESALSSSLLIRVGLLRTQPCMGKPSLRFSLPPWHQLPLQERGAVVLMLLCLPLTLGGPGTVPAHGRWRG